MPRSDQADLFAAEAQPELFVSAPVAYRADADKMRARLHKILTEARAAQTLPWDAVRLSLYRTIFPQMTLWQPGDEAAQLRFAFDGEIRLTQHS